MELTRAEIEDIIEKSTERALVKAFRDVGIGIDGDENLFEIRRDFIFLRDWRMTCEQVRSKGVLSIVGIAITGLIGLLVLGIKGYFG